MLKLKYHYNYKPYLQQLHGKQFKRRFLNLNRYHMPPTNITNKCKVPLNPVLMPLLYFHTLGHTNCTEGDWPTLCTQTSFLTFSAHSLAWEVSITFTATASSVCLFTSSLTLHKEKRRMRARSWREVNGRPEAVMKMACQSHQVLVAYQASTSHHIKRAFLF